MWICIFNETDIRFWLRQDTGAMNRPLRLADCSLRISRCVSWVFPCVRHAFTIRSECIHVMFATCSLSVCYIFAMQKYGFCVAKVWFLACKKGVFALQKYGFCFLNVGLLQFVRNVIAICSQRNGNPSATFWQSVSSRRVRFIVPAYMCSPRICNLSATFWQTTSSRRGPIYRARIYIFATHFVGVWLILKACNGSFAL